MTFQNERSIPAIDGCVIMRNTYYSPADLIKTAEWARAKIATRNVRAAWEVKFLQSEIERIELALATGRAS